MSAAVLRWYGPGMPGREVEVAVRKVQWIPGMSGQFSPSNPCSRSIRRSSPGIMENRKEFDHCDPGSGLLR